MNTAFLSRSLIARLMVGSCFCMIFSVILLRGQTESEIDGTTKVELAVDVLMDPVDAKYQEANRLMLDQQYAEAIVIYQGLIAEHESSNLNHNLGVAHYLNGELGYAVLHFERALRQGFASANTREILSLLRNAEGLSLPRYSFLQRTARSLPEGVWMLIVVTSFWGSFVFGPYIYLMWKRRSVYRDFSIVFLIVFILSSIASIGLLQDRNYGVLVGEDCGLKVIPTLESEMFLEMDGGEVVKALKVSNHFVFIETSSGVRGWVDDDHYRAIRPR